MTRYGLYGIGGVYNFGCEAIVRGVTATLRKNDATSDIVYLTPNYEYDVERLSDLAIEVKKTTKRQSLPRRLLRKSLSLIGAEKRPLRVDIDDLLDGIDVLISIGGDMYTIPAYLRERQKYPYYNHLIDVCDRALEKGIPVILYGASVGPFGEYGKALDYYKKALKRYSRIICREQDSIDYLKSIGVEENVTLFPDPAFCVQGNTVEQDGDSRKYIGLNLSPRSFAELYGGGKEQDGIRKAAALLQGILDDFDEDILLIPHVLAFDSEDNDEIFLERVSATLDPKKRERVHLADCSHGFLGLKPQLRECSMVIAARMHCGINALKEGIPTLFLSYSQKSKGMCRYVYGNERWVIPLQNKGDEVLSRMREMYEEQNAIKDAITKRIAEIDDEWETPISLPVKKA